MSDAGGVTHDSEQDFMRRVVDKIPAMLAYWDTSLRCRFANRAYEWWFGVSPEDLIGKHISELLGPLYLTNLPYIQAALRGETQEFERIIPSPNGGEPRYSLASYIPDIVDGTVRGFFVLVTDVSEIKRAHQALAESEAKFSGIISIAADAIIAVDQGYRIVIFNRSAESIFGYSANEIMGQSLDVLLPEILRGAHRHHVQSFENVRETARHMGERARTIVGRRKNGEEFPAEAAISRLEVNGRVLFTAALRDVTDRQRIETEQQVLIEAGIVLAASLDYVETLKGIAQLSVQHFAEMCIVDLYEKDEQLLRLTIAHRDPAKADLCQQLADLPLKLEHSIARDAILRQQTQLYSSISAEVWRSRAKDSQHFALLEQLNPRSAIVAPLMAGHELLGAIIFASQRPDYYGKRDAIFATELARRTTLAIQNARLYEEARRATQARDDMLSIVAHDVRSPLSAIYLAATSIERHLAKNETDKIPKNIQSILRSFTRANRLIQDLLDISRIDAGHLAIECATLAPQALIFEAIEAHQLMAASASVQLRHALEADLPDIQADHDRLLQVFENLIGNALKFTPAQGIITVAATARPEDVLFSVSDTGKGIAADHLPHVFDRFWQENRTGRQGAGLGLPICKGIIEAHHGHIWVESTVGQGSCFYFSVPRVVTSL